jgi:hypothetical protein
MVLGRMIHYFVPSGKLWSIPAPIFGAGFVLLDVVAFFVQLIGGSMAGPAAPKEEKLQAIRIYMGGIGLQQFFIMVFLAFAIKFQLTMRKAAPADGGHTNSWMAGWRPLLYTLYTSLAFITVSSLISSRIRRQRTHTAPCTDSNHLPIRGVFVGHDGCREPVRDTRIVLLRARGRAHVLGHHRVQHSPSGTHPSGSEV